LAHGAIVKFRAGGNEAPMGCQGAVAGGADKPGRGRSGGGQALIRSRASGGARVFRERPTCRLKASGWAAGTLRVRPLPGACVSRPAGGGGRPRGRRNA
jgi:hypothetical protein